MIVLMTITITVVNLGGKESAAGFILYGFFVLIAFSAIGTDPNTHQDLILVVITGVAIVLLGVLITTLSTHIVLDVIGVLCLTVGIVVLLDTGIGDPLIRELQDLKTVSEMRNAED